MFLLNPFMIIPTHTYLISSCALVKLNVDNSPHYSPYYSTDTSPITPEIVPYLQVLITKKGLFLAYLFQLNNLGRDYNCPLSTHFTSLMFAVNLFRQCLIKSVWRVSRIGISVIKKIVLLEFAL